MDRPAAMLVNISTSATRSSYTKGVVEFSVLHHDGLGFNRIRKYSDFFRGDRKYSKVRMLDKGGAWWNLAVYLSQKGVFVVLKFRRCAAVNFVSGCRPEAQGGSQCQVLKESGRIVSEYLKIVEHEGKKDEILFVSDLQG